MSARLSAILQVELSVDHDVRLDSPDKVLDTESLLADMSENWYQPQQPQNRRPQYQAPGSSVPGGAGDAVNDAHRLLAVYPFASATPTNHGMYHLL